VAAAVGRRNGDERSAVFKNNASAFASASRDASSVLMRGRGMKRCLAEGAERLALFVGAVVLAKTS
jgi:transposase, IS5 family